MKTIYTILVSALCLSVRPAAAQTVTIPNTFTSGTAAKASEVNANFTAVKTAVDAHDTRLTTLEGAANAAAKSFQTTTPDGLTFPATEGDVRTLTVTTPGAGQVVISMNGYIRATHTNGTGSSVVFWIRQGTSGTKRRVINLYAPSSWPSGAFNPAFAFTTAFSIASAGTYSIIISAVSNVTSDWGDCGTLVQGCPWVTIQYFPNTLP